MRLFVWMTCFEGKFFSAHWCVLVIVRWWERGKELSCRAQQRDMYVEFISTGKWGAAIIHMPVLQDKLHYLYTSNKIYLFTTTFKKPSLIVHILILHVAFQLHIPTRWTDIITHSTVSQDPSTRNITFEVLMNHEFFCNNMKASFHLLRQLKENASLKLKHKNYAKMNFLRNWVTNRLCNMFINQLNFNFWYFNFFFKTQYCIWYTDLFQTDAIYIFFYSINNWKSILMLISYFLHAGVTSAFSIIWELYPSKFWISELQSQTVRNIPCLHTHKYVLSRTSNPPGLHRSLISPPHDFHWWLLPKYLTQASTPQQFKQNHFTS